MNKSLHPDCAVALRRAVSVLGSQAALGAACGKTQGHVSHWLKVGCVPSDYCPLIERATRAKGDVVLCESLRPDVEWGELRSHPLALLAAAGGCRAPEKARVYA